MGHAWGEQLAIKFVESIEHGIGGIVAPMQIVRLAKAQAEADRIRAIENARTEIQLDAINAIASTDEAAQAALVQQVRAAQIRRELREAINASAAVEKAAELIKGASAAELPVEAPPELDPDWLSRWREGASHVSMEEMQNLWAKVLAGEFLKPGSFSLRAIDYLRGVSHEEAKLIAALAAFRFFDRSILLRHAKTDGPIPLPDVLELQQTGLIAGVQGTPLSYAWHVSTAPIYIPFLDHCLAVTRVTPKKVAIHAAMLTTVGTEVFSLVPAEANEGALVDWRDEFAKQGCVVEIFRGASRDGQFQPSSRRDDLQIA